MATHDQSEALLRGTRMLRTAFGPAISHFLEDVAIVEVMLSLDGRQSVDGFGMNRAGIAGG